MTGAEYEKLLAEQPDVCVQRDCLGSFIVSCREPKSSLLVDIRIFVRIHADTLERKAVLYVNPQTYRRRNPVSTFPAFCTVGVPLGESPTDFTGLLRKVLFGLHLYKTYRELEQEERCSLWNSRVYDLLDIYNESVWNTISLLQMEYIMSEVTRVLQLIERRHQ